VTPTFSHCSVEYGYSEGGRGDAARSVVFLHGLLVSSEVWAEHMARLQPTHRVLAIDWPGHGSSPPSSQPTSIDDLADAVVSFLDGLAIRRASFVGLSLGGVVALGLASRCPDRVESLVLVSTPLAAETNAQRARHMETLNAAARIGQAAVLRGIAQRLFGATTRRTRPELVAAWLERASRLDLDSVRRLSEAALARSDAPDFGVALPRTLVVHGSEDTLLPRVDSEALAGRFRDGEFLAIPESGHFVPLERPDALAPTLAAFFAKDRDVREAL
jgi:3-oxoadipate enol-lactonase